MFIIEHKGFKNVHIEVKEICTKCVDSKAIDLKKGKRSLAHLLSLAKREFPNIPEMF
jgi:hypothetical protein